MNEQDRALARDAIARERLRREHEADLELEHELEGFVSVAEWGQEVRQLAAEIEYVFGDLPKCPGCGRRFEPSPGRGQVYCTVLCGARARYYIQQGRESKRSLKRYVTGPAAIERDREVRRLRAQGTTLAEIAARFELTKQRVWQILQDREREALAAA